MISQEEIGWASVRSRVRVWAAATLAAVLSLLAFACCLANAPKASAAPFTCASSTVFVGQDSPSRLYVQQYGAGSTSFVPVGPVQPMTYNALAYNETDNYLYAMINTAPAGRLVQIEDDGSTNDLGTVAGLPATAYLLGAMDPAGNYYLTNPASTTAYVVDVAAQTVTSTITLSQSTGASDWTYIDGYLWGATGTTLTRANVATGEVASFTLPAMPAGPYGAAWTFGNGDLGFSNNNLGTVVRVRVAGGASASPSFSIVSTASGPSSSNNDGAACPGQPTDLSITKSGPGTVEPGSQISWSITVTNNGPGDSSGMSVSDTLPAGVSNASTPTPGCNVVGGQVQCVLGFLSSGDSTEIIINATAPPNPATCVTNAVEVVANGVDPDAGNNSATHQTCTRDPLADLQIEKVADAVQAPIGSNIRYTLTVTNNGPDPAQNVAVEDTSSPGLTPVSVTSSQGSCASASACALGTIAAGQKATIEVVAKGAAVGLHGNTATVTTTTDDPDPSNNTSTTTVEVTPLADLRISKQASTNRVNEGEDFSYRLRVVNDGPSTARDVTVSDSIPANVRVRSVTASSGNCSQSAPVVCSLGNLANGAAVDIRIQVTATDAGPTANTSTVTSSTPDPDPSNNQGSSSVDTRRSADLDIIKDASTDVPLVGESFEYRLTVTNKGPSRAIDTVVTDTIPKGLRLNAVQTSRGSCTGARPLVCRLGNLNRDQTVTIRVNVTATTEGAISNGASVTSDSPDPDPSDNTSNKIIDPATQADLQLRKTASVDTVPAGGRVVYGITVTNRGPHGAKDVVVTDPLPAAATLVSVTPSTGSCATEPVIVCRLGDVVAGGAATIRLEVTFDQSASARNVARVTSPTPDPDPSNNEDETTVTSEKADLSVTKRPLNRRVRVGGRASYELIVRNAGPDGARGVVVTDAVPGSLRAVSAEATAGSCEIVRRAVICQLGDLAAGAEAKVTVSTRVLSEGRVRNTASVTSSFPSDPDKSNNSSSSSIRVQPGKTRITVAKRANRRVVNRGDRVRYRIVVSNRGNRTVRNVSVCDRLGAGLAFVQRGGARLVRGQACWRIPSMAPGGRRVLRVTARVLGSSAGTLRNVVTARAGNAQTKRATAGVRRRAVPVRAGGVTG